MNPIFDGNFGSLDVLVKQYFHPREFTKALVKKSNEAIWVQGYSSEKVFSFTSGHLRTIESRPFTGGIENLMSKHISPESLTRVINEFNPDIIHIFGILPADILTVAEVCNSRSIILSASFHGSNPAADYDYRSLQKQAMEKISVLLINAPERKAIWEEANLISPTTRVSICPETSSFFSRLDRAEARARTGMSGDPICVATSRLHPVKDPLTLLMGFENILQMRPGARLYWVHQTNELIDTVNDFLQKSDKLGNAVHLLGPMDFDEMENFYNSADFFLQASHTEYGGNSLVEAMACGVIPVVTKIPSFQYLTGNNQFGTLFDISNSDELSQRVLDIPTEKYGEYSHAIRDYYDRNLSFDLIAERFILAINSIVTGRPN